MNLCRTHPSLKYVSEAPGDGTKIYFSFASKDIDSCLRQVAEDLQHVADLCCANRPLINPDKAKFVLCRVEAPYP